MAEPKRGDLTDATFDQLLDDIMGLYLDGEIAWEECQEQMVALHARRRPPASA